MRYIPFTADQVSTRWHPLVVRNINNPTFCALRAGVDNDGQRDDTLRIAAIGRESGYADGCQATPGIDPFAT
jgi:hypothetical protein